jgi:hypothetical protein
VGGPRRHGGSRDLADPILLRVLPPLAKDASTDKRDPDYVVAVLGLILYVAVVAGVLVLLDID